MRPTCNTVICVGAPLALLASALAVCAWGCVLAGRGALQEGIMQVQELAKGGCAGV